MIADIVRLAERAQPGAIVQRLIRRQETPSPGDFAVVCDGELFLVRVYEGPDGLLVRELGLDGEWKLPSDEDAYNATGDLGVDAYTGPWRRLPDLSVSALPVGAP